MTEAQQNLSDIKQMIADNSDMDHRKVHRLAHHIRDLVNSHGVEGAIALVLVTAEFAASE